jgi:hypothetical protein
MLLVYGATRESDSMGFFFFFFNFFLYVWKEIEFKKAAASALT